MSALDRYGQDVARARYHARGRDAGPGPSLDRLCRLREGVERAEGEPGEFRRLADEAASEDVRAWYEEQAEEARLDREVLALALVAGAADAARQGLAVVDGIRFARPDEVAGEYALFRDRGQVCLRVGVGSFGLPVYEDATTGTSVSGTWERVCERVGTPSKRFSGRSV